MSIVRMVYNSNRTNLKPIIALIATQQPRVSFPLVACNLRWLHGSGSLLELLLALDER